MSPFRIGGELYGETFESTGFLVSANKKEPRLAPFLDFCPEEALNLAPLKERAAEGDRFPGLKPPAEGSRPLLGEEGSTGLLVLCSEGAIDLSQGFKPWELTNEMIRPES
jgi:hypothetical protein